MAQMHGVGGEMTMRDEAGALADNNPFVDGSSNPLFLAPMQLCRPSSCHTYLEAVPETMKALREVEAGVAVVAGVGSQRIGKSTILNLLHSRRTSGFGLGHTLDAQTAGIWIWLRPHPKDPDVVVCFADTEGLDTPHIQQSYNWMLSSLTLLISSVFLYQSKSTIDSSATDRLSTILAVAEQMLGQDDSTIHSKPAFLWVLRDMQLKMHHDPKTEMMEKLETGHIRKMKRSFKDFDCFPLPRPVDTEEDLQEVEKMEFTALKANFQEDFFLLDRLVFQLASSTATVGSDRVTGVLLAELVVRHIDAIRERKGLLSNITDLPSQAQLIAKMAAEKALKDGKTSYMKSMEAVLPRLPLPLDEVYSLHTQALSAAEEVAKEAALGVEQDDMRALCEELRAFALAEHSALRVSPNFDEDRGDVSFHSERPVTGHLLTVLERNHKLSREAAEGLLLQEYARIRAGVEEDPCFYPGVKEFDADVTAMKQALLDKAHSCGGRQVMSQMLEANTTMAEHREAVLLHSISRQMRAQQDSLQERIKTLEEALLHKLSAAEDGMQEALKQEGVERRMLDASLRQVVAESCLKESEARQALTAHVQEEHTQRVQAVADITSSVQKEASERNKQIGEVGGEVKACEKQLMELRLSTADSIAHVRESVSALDSKGMAARHELESEAREMRDKVLETLDKQLTAMKSQQTEALAGVRKESERSDEEATTKRRELEKSLTSALEKQEEQLKLLKRSTEDENIAKRTELAAVLSTQSGFDTRLSSMLQTHERMQERIEAAEAKVTEAASSAAAVKDLEAKIEKIHAELNGKVSEATASAAAAKEDMEKAAASAIASAHRGGAGGALGESSSTAGGGMASRMRDFFKRFQV